MYFIPSELLVLCPPPSTQIFWVRRWLREGLGGLKSRSVARKNFWGEAETLGKKIKLILQGSDGGRQCAREKF